jgi:DNA-binding NtrC family response regulator
MERVHMAIRVLIIDDDRDTADFLRLLVEPRGDLVRIASDAAEAREILRSWRPEVALMDLMLPDADGLELLRDFKETSPDTQVIMVTGFGSVPKAVEAMKFGAFSFIEKPVDADVMLVMLDKATETVRLSAENRRLKEELREHTSFANIVARSDKMRQLFHLIKSVAPTDASVLIHGENGTGKELVASALHEHSKRKKGPFIKINCAALPSELIESELFGHKRGAFTGAVSDKIGLMELADGGSLLLDEIGEMPPSLQVKLLRVLQDREFRPVGGSRVLQPNFRLICATNVNLDAALGEGKLREDLYFRINTVTLAIPPLRDRPEDILLLAEHFLARFSGQHERNIRSITPEATKALLRYRWPGNVRELEHVIERAVIVAEGHDVTLDDMPPAICDAERLPNQAAFVIPPHHTLEEIEKLAILQTLERTRGNKRKAASILGVYRPTLYNKLKKYNLFEAVARAPRAPALAETQKPASDGPSETASVASPGATRS